MAHLPPPLADQRFSCIFSCITFTVLTTSYIYVTQSSCISTALNSPPELHDHIQMPSRHPDWDAPQNNCHSTTPKSERLCLCPPPCPVSCAPHLSGCRHHVWPLKPETTGLPVSCLSAPPFTSNLQDLYLLLTSLQCVVTLSSLLLLFSLRRCSKLS